MQRLTGSQEPPDSLLLGWATARSLQPPSVTREGCGSEAALTLPASEGVYRLLRSSAIVRKTVTFHSTSPPHPFFALRMTQRSAVLFFSDLSSAKAGSFVWLTCNQRRRGKPLRNCQMSHLHMQRRPAAQEWPWGQKRCPV